MIDSLKFKDTKGNWFKIESNRDALYIALSKVADDKKLQKYMTDTFHKGRSDFYYLTLYKGNIDKFEFEKMDFLEGIFAECSQQGKERLSVALRDILKRNSIEKSIIDNINIDEYGYLSFK